MSLSTIRPFFTARLLEVDSDFKPHVEPFTDENIGDNVFNKKYHIFYGSVQSTVPNQNTTQDVVTATVSLYFKGYANAQESLDKSMDLANKFRLISMHPMKILGQEFIKRVICTQILAEPLQSNTEAIKITLTFNINMVFGTNNNLQCE